MNLYQHLTQALFLEQISRRQPSAQWHYVRGDHVRYRSTKHHLEVDVLPTRRVATSLRYRFSFAGAPSYQTQRHVLHAFGWSFAQLLRAADEHHALQLRYDQIRYPEATRAPYVSFNVLDTGLTRPLRVYLSLLDVPAAFTPFALLLPDKLLAQAPRRGRLTYTREQILQHVAAGRLRPLPTSLLDSHHVLDGILPGELAYPLEHLGLLPLLADTSWQLTLLPGRLLQLTGPELGAAPLFLQPVRPAAKPRAAVGRASMHIAA